MEVAAEHGSDDDSAIRVGELFGEEFEPPVAYAANRNAMPWGKAAHGYAGIGWKIVPVARHKVGTTVAKVSCEELGHSPATCPRGDLAKDLDKRGHGGHHAASNELSRFEGISPHCNIGVATGIKGGLVVLGEDAPGATIRWLSHHGIDASFMDDAPVTHSRSGNRQYWFTLPSGCVEPIPSSCWPEDFKLDVIADGKVAMAPPSVVPKSKNRKKANTAPGEARDSGTVEEYVAYGWEPGRILMDDCKPPELPIAVIELIRAVGDKADSGGSGGGGGTVTAPERGVVRALDRMLDALDDVGAEPYLNSDSWRARCPAHNGDSGNSLSVRVGEIKVLLHCFAGCSEDALLSALGLGPNDLRLSKLPDWPAGMPSDNNERVSASVDTSASASAATDWKTKFDELLTAYAQKHVTVEQKVRTFVDCILALRSAEADAKKAAKAARKAGDQPSVYYPVLPEAFWTSRPVLEHLRRAAWAGKAAPDAVLHCVLGRISALRSHRIVFDSGMGDPEASLNFFSVITGVSGGYKSTAAGVAKRLIKPSPFMEPATPLPIGSGEGLLEAYMGYVDKETGQTNRDGTPKTVRVKEQTSHNQFFYVDEGKALNQLVFARQGSTLGPVMRELWNGGTTGMTNAREETTRVLHGGTYSLGIIVGYQPDVVVDLLNDSGSGMPQRFCWAWSKNPNHPRGRVPWPGHLPVNMTALMASETRIMSFPESVKDELDEQCGGRLRGEVADLAELDGHQPFTQCKVAALLALLDSRNTVNGEDWLLAQVIWDVSRGVREGLIEQAKRVNHDKKMKKREDFVADHVATEKAKRELVDPTIKRLARRVVELVRKAGDNELTEGSLWRQMASRDKPRRSEVMTFVYDRQWIEPKDPPEAHGRPSAKPSTPLLAIGRVSPEDC